MSRNVYHFIIIIMLIMALSLGFSGCGWFAPNEPQSSDRTSVTTSVNFPAQTMATADIDSVALMVFGGDVDTMRTEMVLDGTRATGSIQVPVNKTLTFQVTVYDVNKLVLLQGQTVTSVAKNQTNSIPITLDFMVPAMILTPTQLTTFVGDTIEVKLNARNVSNMTALGARIAFDQTRLEVLDMQVDPDFLSGQNGQVVLLPVEQDFTAGKVDFVMGVVPATSSVSGDGELGIVKFRTLVADTVDLNVVMDSTQDSDLGLYNSTAQSVDVLTLGNRLVIQATAN